MRDSSGLVILQHESLFHSFPNGLMGYRKEAFAFRIASNRSCHIIVQLAAIDRLIPTILGLSTPHLQRFPRRSVPIICRAISCKECMSRVTEAMTGNCLHLL